MVDAVDAAIAAERALLDPAIRSDRDAVDRLLDAEFAEIGRGGRVWTRAEILAALEDDPGQVVATSDMHGRVISEGIVLVTYVSNAVRRSTLWRVSGTGECAALFHQGTPIA